jgi:hypothetical protein
MSIEGFCSYPDPQRAILETISPVAFYDGALLKSVNLLLGGYLIRNASVGHPTARLAKSGLVNGQQFVPAGGMTGRSPSSPRVFHRFHHGHPFIRLLQVFRMDEQIVLRLIGRIEFA